MHYSVPEAARLLGVSEDLVYGWIRNEGLPATIFGGRYHLNNVKLIDWAHRNQIPLPVQGVLAAPVLEEALSRGGVLHDIPPVSLSEALEHIFRKHLGLEPGLSEKILSMLKTRENFGWSVDASKVAVPTLRAPLVVLSESSRVFIAYSKETQKELPAKGVPNILFIILVSAYSMHLNLLSRCIFSLRDPNFRELLNKRPEVEALVQCMRGFTSEPTTSALHKHEAIDLF